MSVQGADPSDFWVITAFFNLAGWSSRIDNYHAFRRALSVPLATIEWNPSGRFDLGDADADLLIQRQGGDLMWQKERLLGILLAALPEHVRYVAWVDCDVIFADPQWHERTRRLLQDCLVVQPFRRVVYLPRAATRRLIGGQDSLEAVLRGVPSGHALAAGGASDGEGCDWVAPGHPLRASFLDAFEHVHDDIARFDLDRRFEAGGGNRYDVTRPTCGYAWSARFDAIRRIGFYERCVVGGGDLLFAYGLAGQHAEVVANHHSVGWDFYGGGASYRAWALQAADLCRGRFKCGDETIVHLYHGSLENRQSRSRVDGLARFGLDIERDIVADPGAPWSWTRDASELNGYFLQYMRNRKEDS